MRGRGTDKQYKCSVKLYAARGGLGCMEVCMDGWTILSIRAADLFRSAGWLSPVQGNQHAPLLL
jgi:hypothetical protein